MDIVMLPDLIRMIEQGEPIPARYRPAVAQVLRKAASLEQALYVAYYRSLGFPLSKCETTPGSAYNMTGLVFHKNASTAESSYRKYRKLFKQGEAAEAAESAESGEFQTDPCTYLN